MNENNNKLCSGLHQCYISTSSLNRSLSGEMSCRSVIMYTLDCLAYVKNRPFMPLNERKKIGCKNVNGDQLLLCFVLQFKLFFSLRSLLL